MPISVRFTKRKGYDTMQIRITVDGVEGSLFSTLFDGSTKTIGGTWNQKKQKRTDRTDEAETFNKELRAIVTDCEGICQTQRQAGHQPTPKTIQHQYQTGEPPESQLPKRPETPPDNLIDIYRMKLITLMSYKGTENELTKSTIQKWEYCLNYLTAFLSERGQTSLRLEHLSVGWAKEFHLWLMKSGPMAPDAATRYLNKLSDAIDLHIDHLAPPERRGAYNPIAGHKFGRGKTKDVYFLEKPHLERFWQLGNRGEAGKCIWWMGFIFLTGLDYPDAVRYLSDRAKYDRMGTLRPYIEIRRSKPPKSMCRIPVWPELTALLSDIPAGDPPTADDINDYMKGVEVLVSFEHRLTCKVGRKTAGYIFLLRGYTIRAVSRILGHSSIAITETYYVKITAELVQQEDDRLV